MTSIIVAAVVGAIAATVGWIVWAYLAMKP